YGRSGSEFDSFELQFERLSVHVEGNDTLELRGQTIRQIPVRIPAERSGFKLRITIEQRVQLLCALRALCPALVGIELAQVEISRGFGVVVSVTDREKRGHGVLRGAPAELVLSSRIRGGRSLSCDTAATAQCAEAHCEKRDNNEALHRFLEGSRQRSCGRG